MLTEKYIQLIGNMAANRLMRRYSHLDIKFFAGKRGDMMRMYMVQRDDKRQLTGRLYDVEPNPGLQTRWVKELADRIEAKMLEGVKQFLGPAQDTTPPTADSPTAPDLKPPTDNPQPSTGAEAGSGTM